MNSLLENRHITEMLCGSNFSYILEDDNTFSSTEYKVLQSQVDSCFVRCMKMLYNGKIQLYYLTESLKPLSSMMALLDENSFLTVVSNLLSDIIDINHNGFLSCQNLDISFENIYVDTATYKVKWIYLPLSNRIYPDNLTFENELRSELVKRISDASNISSSKIEQFAADLSNGILSVEDLHIRIRGGNVETYKSPNSNNDNTNLGNLRFVAMNAPSHVEFEITKDEFKIGKKAELVDGLISFNKMISRLHCKINKTGNQYTITDLQSANGTYVNGERIQPNQPQPIKNGDIVRLANSDFQIVMG